jgi:HK97 gp10 family phage protein
MTDFDGFEDAADDFDSFADKLRDVAARLPSAVDSGAQRTAMTIQGTAQANAPVDRGELRQKIETRRIELAAYQVISAAPHAQAVEFGTDPHVITPNSADALAFEGQNGELIFRQRVEHPGTPAQPYLRPAVRQHQSELTENINDAINELFRQVFST